MRIKTLTILTTGLVALLALPAWTQDTKDTSSPRTDILSPDGLTREEMVAALVMGLGLNDYTPPDCVAGQEMFDDVPASSLFCPWIEELARRGITGGCGGGNYCPTAPVTRAQMAAFLLKAQFPTQVPPGVTVTGRWGFDVHTDGSGDWGTSISYPVAMPGALQVSYIDASTTDECPGPLLAAPGFLCIYELNALQSAFVGTVGNTRYGTTIYFSPTGSGDMYAHGVWAATAVFVPPV